MTNEFPTGYFYVLAMLTLKKTHCKSYFIFVSELSRSEKRYRKREPQKEKINPLL